MFDFESAAGQAFIKDNRLKAYNWTNTGIKFNIPSINKEIHLGKYEGEVDIGPDYKANSIHIKQIFGQSVLCFHYNKGCKNIIFFSFACLNNIIY